MTEEIIIDGVNVAGCLNYYKKDGSCMSGDCECTLCIHNDCYYKQLKRLEQEHNTICYNLGLLKQENKELKKGVQLFKCLDTFGENECHCACRCLGNEFCEDADKKINNCRSALEEIKELAKNGNAIDGIRLKIIDKINEVLND